MKHKLLLFAMLALSLGSCGQGSNDVIYQDSRYSGYTVLHSDGTASEYFDPNDLSTGNILLDAVALIGAMVCDVDPETNLLIVGKGYWERKHDKQVGEYIEIKIKAIRNISSYIIVPSTSTQYDDLFSAKSRLDPVPLIRIKKLPVVIIQDKEQKQDNRDAHGYVPNNPTDAYQSTEDFYRKNREGIENGTRDGAGTSRVLGGN